MIRLAPWWQTSDLLLASELRHSPPVAEASGARG
jgi:hypothetical protein